MTGSFLQEVIEAVLRSGVAGMIVLIIAASCGLGAGRKFRVAKNRAANA